MSDDDEATSLWGFTHESDPDYDDPDDVVALGREAYLTTDAIDHPLMTASPWADWMVTEGADGDRDTHSIDQSWWDLWCLEGARSEWLAGVTDVLKYSVRPEAGCQVFEALVGVGGLELDDSVKDPDTLLRRIRAAAKEATNDARLILGEDDFFAHQANPIGGVPARYGFAYAFAGATAISDHMDLSAVGRLGFAVRPRMLSADRNGANNSYVKVLDAMRSLTAVRSEFFKQAVSAPGSLNAPEVADMIMSTWLLLHLHTPELYTAERPSKRAIDMELEARLSFGNDLQRSAAFTECFRKITEPLTRVRQVLGKDEGTLGEAIGRYEQLSVMLVPGARWDTVACAQAVELRLLDWMPIINSISNATGAEKIEKLRSAMAGLLNQTAGAAGGATNNQSDAKGNIGSSGMEALRLQCFINSSAQLKSILAEEEPNPSRMFDALFDSDSKLLYMLAIGHLTKKTGCQVVQDCSPFISELNIYWAQCLGDGIEEAEKRLQGKRIDEASVKALLSGDWHLVDWVKICDDLARWVDGSVAVGSGKLHEFQTLARVESVLVSTFEMLRLDVTSSISKATNSSSEGSASGDSSGSSVRSVNRRGSKGPARGAQLTFSGLFKRIMRLQAKSGMLAVGSLQRSNHEHNVRSIIMLMLKSAGKRWARQFVGEVNYTAPLQTAFLTDESYVLNELEKMEKVAGQLFEFKEVLPSLMGAWTEPEHDELADVEEELGSSKSAKQRSNKGKLFTAFVTDLVMSGQWGALKS